MMWIRMAAILMFLAVLIGAFGAHGLKNILTAEAVKTYQTAVLYHFIHALGIFVVAWLSMRSPDFKIKLAGIFFVAGILLFSGSLYALSVTGVRWLGAITPLGGICFLAGWLCLAFANYTS